MAHLPFFSGQTAQGTPALRAKLVDLPAGDFGKHEYLAIAGDLLQQRVLVDLAVDGDGKVRFQLRPQVRIALAQRLKKLAYVGDLEVELRLTACVRRQIAGQ